MEDWSRSSLTGRTWALAPAGDHDVSGWSLPPVAARCLSRRLRRPDPRAWLKPDLAHLHDPHQMLGMDVALDRIRRAIRDGERVRIVTDYDVDGTTSSLILQSTLRILGVHEALSYHIPDRQVEGYGFSVQAAQKAADDGVGLLVTADIGVRDHAAVRAAQERGVDVIVCDHHLPDGGAVPADAHAVLCPPQPGCDYPNPALAACGVSLKLAQALLREHPRYDRFVHSMLKVAAIGTVADVVDLGTQENRAIVALGIEALRQGPHSPGLSALMAVSGVAPDSVRASDLGFRIGPRINAAGRLESAMAVVELFFERDPRRATERAEALDALNRERQGIQRRLTAAVLAELPADPPPFVLAWGPEAEGWHKGVVGIVAARVRDAVHRPAAVISVQGDRAVGSVRSVSAVHAVQALDQARDLLVKYGGHPVAAGFTVPTEHLEALRERLCAAVTAQASTDALVPRLTVEARVPRAEANEALAEAIERLGPFGKGNPEPLLALEAVTPRDLRPLGKAGKHLRFSAGGLDAVWWSGDRFARDLQGPVELVGRLGFNSWRGRRTLRFTVEDARPA